VNFTTAPPNPRSFRGFLPASARRPVPARPWRRNGRIFDQPTVASAAVTMPRERAPDDQHPQLPARLELFAGQRARHHAQGDGLEFDALHTMTVGASSSNSPATVIHRVFTLLVQDLVDAVQVGGGRHRDVHHRASPVLRQIDRLDDLAVGNGENLAIEERSLVTRSSRPRRCPASGTPAMVNSTRSPKPYCFSTMMKNPKAGP